MSMAQRQIRRFGGAALRGRNSIAQMSIQYRSKVLGGPVVMQLGQTKRWKSNFSPFRFLEDENAEKEMHAKMFERISKHQINDKSCYKFKGKVHYVTSLEEEKRVFNRHFNSELRNPQIGISAKTKDDKIKFVVGFDSETSPANNRFHPPSVVQISTPGTCIVYHLTHKNFIRDCTFPPFLKQLLADKDVLKVGVGCAIDAQELTHAYGISVSNVLELNNLENVMARTEQKIVGLKKLCQVVLDKKMHKTLDITCSNWGREELTDLQKMYAAHDASVAIDIWKAIDDSEKSGITVDENILSDFLFHPENFAREGKVQIPTVYERSSIRTKKWKELFVKSVEREIEDATSTEKSDNNVRKSDYIRSKSSDKPISDSFVRLYISYLHKAVVDSKAGELGSRSDKPLMLLPMYFPPLLRKIFHGIAVSNGLYTVSHGQKKGNPRLGRMLSIWPSRLAYVKAREKHGASR